MYETTVTVWISDLIGIEVNDPVLDAGSAAEGDNNSVELLRVAWVTEDVQDRVTEGLCLNS